MKIILNQAIDSLGSEGEILDVKPGFARNYLIPKGWAKQATKINIAATQKEIEAKEKKEAKTRENLEALGKVLDKLSLKFELKAGKEGKLFGSVTNRDLRDLLKEKEFDFERRAIQLSSPIRNVGNHEFTIRVHSEVSVTMQIKVIGDSDKTAVKTVAVDEPTEKSEEETKIDNEELEKLEKLEENEQV